MTTDVIVQSAHDGTALRFSDATPWNDEGGFISFAVTVDGPMVHASARVDGYESSTLASYFENIAACWKGWKGEKKWSNLENELELTATSDTLGHVFLSFTLRSGHHDYAWTASGKLLLEAAQLDRIAHDFSFFYSRSVV
jgi:hypothetical protein